MPQAVFKANPTKHLLRDMPYVRIRMREIGIDGQEECYVFNVPTDETPEFFHAMRELRGPICLSICRPGNSEFEREMCR